MSIVHVATMPSTRSSGKMLTDRKQPPSKGLAGSATNKRTLPNMSHPTGSGQEVGNPAAALPVQCTYNYCIERFADQKSMRRHKKDAPQHNYCKKCDVDYQDYEELVQHKVTLMDDFWRNLPHPKGAGPRHITCEFCGQDFESFGGREGHRQQMHKADQDIRCPGCDALFTKAGHMVAHLEDGHCQSISRFEFKASILHKHILNEVMKDPEKVQVKMLSYKAFEAVPEKPGLVPPQVTDGSEMHGQDDGDVSLLDQTHPEQKTGHNPLQPEFDLMTEEQPMDTRSANETWPTLPGIKEAPNDLAERLRGLSVRTSTSSLASTKCCASEVVSDVTSHCSGNTVYTESYPSLESSTVALVYSNDDTVSVASYVVTSKPRKPSAWTTGQTPKAIFTDARPKPPVGDWATMVKQKEEDMVTTDNSTNLLYSRFDDPTSNDWDVERFFHTTISMYICPFPDCEAVYAIPADMEGHFKHAHLNVKYVCPMCLKRFGSATAQVSHMESAGRCRVKDSRNFKKLLDEITGGFLKAKQLSMPFLYNKDKAVVKAGQRMVEGVKPVVYTAKLPHQT